MFLVKHIFNTTIILFYLASVKGFVNNNFISPEINIRSNNLLLHSSDTIKNENRTCYAKVKDYYNGYMNPIDRVRKYTINNFEKSTPLSTRYRITRERKLYLDDVSKMETSSIIMPLLNNRKQITRTVLLQRSNENRVTNRREIRKDNLAECYKTRNSKINERREIDNRNLIDVEENKRIRTMQYRSANKIDTNRRVDRRNTELLTNENGRTRDINRISRSNNAKSETNNNRFSMERNLPLERIRSNNELPIDGIRTINNERSRTVRNNVYTLRVRSIEDIEERQLQNKEVRQREFPRNKEAFIRSRSSNKIDRISEQILSTNTNRRVVDRRNAEILTDSNRRTREIDTLYRSNNAKSETGNRISIDRNLLLERTRSNYELPIDRMRTINNQRSRNLPNNAGVRDNTLRIRSIEDIEERQLQNRRDNQREFTRNDESVMFRNRAYRADDRRHDLKSNTDLYNGARRSLKDIDSNDIIRNRRVIDRRILQATPVRDQKIDNEKILNASRMEKRNVREQGRYTLLHQRVQKSSNREETERLSCDKASSAITSRLRREPVNVRRIAKKDKRSLGYRTISVLDDVEDAVISPERNYRERYVSARQRVVDRKSRELLLDENRERKTRHVTRLFGISYSRNQVSEEREHITPNYQTQVVASLNRVIRTNINFGNDRSSDFIRSRSLSERYSQNRKADYSYINQPSRISKDQRALPNIFLMHRVIDHVIQPTRDRTIQIRDRMLTERKNPSEQKIILNSADRRTIINDKVFRTARSYMIPIKDTTIDRRVSSHDRIISENDLKSRLYLIQDKRQINNDADHEYLDDRKDSLYSARLILHDKGSSYRTDRRRHISKIVTLTMDNNDKTLSIYRYRKGSTISRFVQDNYSKYDMWQSLNTNLHWTSIAKLLLTILPLLQIYRSSANIKTLYPDERTNYGLF